MSTDQMKDGNYHRKTARCKQKESVKREAGVYAKKIVDRLKPSALYKYQQKILWNFIMLRYS
ncbi:MAG: hypothetical protein LBC55_08080, partial [Desulfovibrio sp.]|nr:hypothetical protein [Desulfovibrio sp.]